MSANLSSILFLITGILFILALRGLSSPETSRMGNFFGITGMIVAIVVSILSVDIFFSNLIYFIIALSIGAAPLHLSRRDACILINPCFGISRKFFGISCP